MIYIRGLNSNWLEGHILEKNAPRAAVYKKKAFAGRKIQEESSKKAKFDQTLCFCYFFEVFAGSTNASGGPHAARGLHV
jgi:hypothetical protein